MISLVCIDSKLLTNNNWYGRFQLAPFRKSEGLTIANALRRTLLAEKSNFYISWVDLYNAEIPYSVLTGMRESIFDILLNLKQIIFTSDIIMAHSFHTPNLNRSLNSNEFKNKPHKKEEIFQSYEKNKILKSDSWQGDSKKTLSSSSFMQTNFDTKSHRNFNLLNNKRNGLNSNFIRSFLSSSRVALPSLSFGDKKGSASRGKSFSNYFFRDAKAKTFPNNFQNNKRALQGSFKGSSFFIRQSAEPPKNMNSYVKNKNFFSKSDDFCNPVIIGYICVKGPATIYGKNLKLPKGLKCLNPNQYIVTLSDDGVFFFRFAIHYELENQLVLNTIPREFPFFPVSLMELNQNQNLFWKTLFSSVNIISLPNPQRKLFEQAKGQIISNDEKYKYDRNKKYLMNKNNFTSDIFYSLKGYKRYRDVTTSGGSSRKGCDDIFESPKSSRRYRDVKTSKFFNRPKDDQRYSDAKAKIINSNKVFQIKVKKSIESIKKKKLFKTDIFKNFHILRFSPKSDFWQTKNFFNKTLKINSPFLQFHKTSVSLFPTLPSSSLSLAEKKEQKENNSGKGWKFSEFPNSKSKNLNLFRQIKLNNYFWHWKKENKSLALPSLSPKDKERSATREHSSPYSIFLRKLKETSSKMPKSIFCHTPWFLENVYQNFFICFRKKQRCFKINSLGLIEKSLNPLANSESDALKKISVPLILSTNTEEKIKKNFCTCQNSTILSNIKKTCLINLQVKHSYYKSGCLDRFLVDLLKLFKPSISVGSKLSTCFLRDAKASSRVTLPSLTPVGKKELKIPFSPPVLCKPPAVRRIFDSSFTPVLTFWDKKRSTSRNLLWMARQFYGNPQKRFLSTIRKKIKGKRKAGKEKFIFPISKTSITLRKKNNGVEKFSPVWHMQTINTFNMQSFISSFMKKKTSSSNSQKGVKLNKKQQKKNLSQKSSQKPISRKTLKKPILKNQPLFQKELKIKDFLHLRIIAEKTFYNQLAFLKNQKKLNFSSLPISNNDTQSLIFFIPNNTIILKPSYLNSEPLFHILKQSVKFHENQRILSRNLNLFFSVSISFILLVLVSNLFLLVGIDWKIFSYGESSLLFSGQEPKKERERKKQNVELRGDLAVPFDKSNIYKRENAKTRRKRDVATNLKNYFFRDTSATYTHLKPQATIKKISSGIEENLNKLLWSYLWPSILGPFFFEGKGKTIKLKEKKRKHKTWNRKHNQGKIKNFNILWNSNHKKKITCSKKYYQTFYHSKIYFSLRYTYPLKYTIFSHYSSMGWFSKIKNNSVDRAILNRLSFFSKIRFSSFVSSFKENIAIKKRQKKNQSQKKQQKKNQRPILEWVFKKPIKINPPLLSPIVRTTANDQIDYKQIIKKKNFYYLPPKNVNPWWVPYSESFKIYTNLMTYESLFNYKQYNRASLIQKTNGTVTKTDNFLFLDEENMDKIDNFSFLKYEMALDKENFSIFFPYKSFVIPWIPKKDKNSQTQISTFQYFDYLELPEPEKEKKVFFIYDKSELVNFEIFKETYLEKINNGTLYNSIHNFYIPFDYMLNNIIFPSFYWFNSVTFSYRHRHKTHTITQGDAANLTSSGSDFSEKEKKFISSPLKKNYQRFIPTLSINIMKKPSIIKAKIKNNLLSTEVKNYIQKYLSITNSNYNFLIQLILFISSQRKKKFFHVANQNITTKILNQKTFNDAFILVNSVFTFSEKKKERSHIFENNSSFRVVPFNKSLDQLKETDTMQASALSSRSVKVSRRERSTKKNKIFQIQNPTNQEKNKKKFPFISSVFPRLILENQKSFNKDDQVIFSDFSNFQKQWMGPQKKTINIYKSHFPYTFLSREKNNVFFSNFMPTNLVSISSENETISLSNKEISWFQPNQKFFRLRSPSKLLLQTFIKTHTNHYIRDKNFLLAYLNTKKFIINPFKKQDGYDSLFQYLKSCQIKKSLISENLLTTYKYFQSSNLLKEDFLNSLMKKDFRTNEFFELKQKKKDKDKLKGLKFFFDKKYRNLFQPSLTSSRDAKVVPFDRSIDKKANLKGKEQKKKWGRKRNKWQKATEKKQTRTISNTQLVMANNFPQNFTVKSKNFHFNQLHEKIKIPVAFEIFLNRRFLWNSNKITLQILNRQAFVVSLASDRKFKMATLKPLFKEAKIKKIAFLKHGYRRMDHQQKVSKIMFYNLQLSGLKNYQNYFSKISFSKDFSWLNKIEQIYKKSILPLSYSNPVSRKSLFSSKKYRGRKVKYNLKTSLAIFKEIRLPAIIFGSYILNSSLPFSPQASRVRFTKKRKNNKGKLVNKQPFLTYRLDKFYPSVYSLIGEKNQFIINLSQHKLKRVTNQLNKSLVPINWKLFSFVEQNIALKEIKRFYAFFLKPSFANFSRDIQQLLPNQTMQKTPTTTLDSLSQANEKEQMLKKENNPIDLWSCKFFSKYFVYTTSLESDLFFQNFLNFSFSKFDLNKIFSKRPTFSISRSYFTEKELIKFNETQALSVDTSLKNVRTDNRNYHKLFSTGGKEESSIFLPAGSLHSTGLGRGQDLKISRRKSGIKKNSILNQFNLSFIKPKLHSYLLENEESRSISNQVKNISLRLVPFDRFLENSFLNITSKRKKKLFYFGKLTQKIETNFFLKKPQQDSVENQTNQIFPRPVFQNFYLISRQLGFDKMGIESASAGKQIFPWSKNKHKITLCYFTIKESLNPIYKVNYIIENFEMTWDKIPISFRQKQQEKPINWNPYIKNLFPLNLLTKQILIGSILDRKANKQNMGKTIPPSSFSIHFPSKRRKKSLQKIEEKKKKYLVIKNSDRLHRSNFSLPIIKTMKKRTLLPGKSINKWQTWYSFLIKKNKTSLIVLNNYNGVISIPKWKNKNSFSVPLSLSKRENNNEIIQNSYYNQINPTENDIKNEYIQIDIWTNGSISPRQSLVNAFQKLFELFCNLSNNISIKNNNVLTPEWEREFIIIDDSDEKDKEKEKDEEEKENTKTEFTDSLPSSSSNLSENYTNLNPDT